jgi:hypothetical protein
MCPEDLRRDLAVEAIFVDPNVRWDDVVAQLDDPAAAERACEERSE